MVPYYVGMQPGVRPARPAFAKTLSLVCAGYWLLTACAMPTAPREAALGLGRWTGDGCLSVSADGCNFVAGCAHGQFPRPVVRVDGTFDVDGTYRVEAGPVSIEPAPPAHFSGSVSGDTITLTVTPQSLAPGRYTLRATTAGTCTVPCL